MQKLKGGVFMFVAIGLIIAVALVTFIGYRLATQYMSSRVNLNFQISLEQDYKSTYLTSMLWLTSPETKGLSYLEVIGGSIANNIENYSSGLSIVKNTIKKIESMEKRNLSLGVKYENKLVPINQKPEGDTYKIDIPLPGGEKGELLATKIL